MPESAYFMTPAKQDPQGDGSALTYARRYAIMTYLGIAAEDDDGNIATHGRSTPRQQRHSRPSAGGAEIHGGLDGTPEEPEYGALPKDKPLAQMSLAEARNAILELEKQKGVTGQRRIDLRQKFTDTPQMSDDPARLAVYHDALSKLET